MISCRQPVRSNGLKQDICLILKIDGHEISLLISKMLFLTASASWLGKIYGEFGIRLHQETVKPCGVYQQSIARCLITLSAKIGNPIRQHSSSEYFRASFQS